jgi:hypothetical protein
MNILFSDQGESDVCNKNSHGRDKNTQTILKGNPKRKTPLGRPRRR